MWFALSPTWASLSTDQKLRTWQAKNLESTAECWEVPMYQPKNKNKTAQLFGWKYQPRLAFGPLFTCKDWRIFFLPFSPRQPVSTRVTHHEGLTWLDYCFHVNNCTHLTAKHYLLWWFSAGNKATWAHWKRAQHIQQDSAWNLISFPLW